MTGCAREPVLIPDPPRAVPRWFVLRRMPVMAILGPVLVATGLAIGGTIVAVFSSLGERLAPLADLNLDFGHASTRGVVVAKRVIESVRMNRRHPWRIDFTFSTPTDPSVRGHGYILDEALAALAVGDPVEVQYDPAAPPVARPVGGSASLVPLWLFAVLSGVVGLEVCLGAALMLLVWRRSRAERTLLEHGVGVVAEVTDVKVVRSINWGWHHPYDVRYQFVDYGGQTREGRDRTYHPAWAAKLQVGSAVGVIYNPVAPVHNVLWLHGKDAETCAPTWR